MTDLSIKGPAVALTDGANIPSSKSANAAQQFEALLITQMLKSMRESGSGWLGTGEDKAGESAMGMAEEHLAASLSASGGFGIAHMIQQSLDQNSTPQKLQE